MPSGASPFRSATSALITTQAPRRPRTGSRCPPKSRRPAAPVGSSTRLEVVSARMPSSLATVTSGGTAARCLCRRPPPVTVIGTISSLNSAASAGRGALLAARRRTRPDAPARSSSASRPPRRSAAWSSRFPARAPRASLRHQVAVRLVLHARDRFHAAGDEHSPSPAITRCAAIAIVCRPEEQKRLTVMPGTSPAAGADRDLPRDVLPVAPSGRRAAHDHVFDLGRVELRALDRGLATWPPSVAPCVMLKPPRQDLASPCGRSRR